MSYLVVWLPYVLSALTIWSMFLAGEKKRGAWLIGLINQLLWLVWICATKSWGLLPMNIALWVVYGRNYWKWGRPNKSTV